MPASRRFARRDDRLTGYVVLLRDVTERRHLEEQLRQAQKMEAVGKLAGGVAHDFNNLLTAIIGFAALASDELPTGSPVHAALAQIRRSAEQAASLTRQLLAFGRRQILQPEVLDLGEVIGHVLPMLRRLIGEDITVITELLPDVPTIRADRTQVQQVLLNLVVNARDAMPRGGTLTIRTSLTTVETRNNEGPDVAPGRLRRARGRRHRPGRGRRDGRPHLRALLHHQGVRPGHRAGPVDGLRHRQAEWRRRAGAVHAGPRRDVSRGAARRADARRHPAAPEPLSVPGHAAAGTVLLAEDDEGVRDFVGEVLRASGWTVVTAASPAEALASAARQSLTIDLLVTDVVMPGMNGGELADKLVAMRPGLRVLFITGYDDEDIATRGLIGPGRECLSKPFTPAQLRARVQALLASSL